jgi:hypothetical protein
MSSKKDDAIWNLAVLRDALKRKSVSTEQPVQWLGMCELLHDTLHKLDANCGDPHCGTCLRFGAGAPIKRKSRGSREAGDGQFRLDPVVRLNWVDGGKDFCSHLP